MNWHWAAKDGSQSSLTWRLLDPDRHDWHVATKDALGKTTLDVQGTAIRQGKPGWVQLFNGKDLKGWTGETKDWKVENEVLVSTGKPALLRTEKSFKDFTLRFETWTEPIGDFLLPYWDVCLHHRDDETDKDVQQVLLQLVPEVKIGNAQSGASSFDILDFK